MKEIQITQYIAEDGKTFNNKEDCIKYENEILTHRQLINQFELYDANLNKIEKPKFLWASTEGGLQEEMTQNSELFWNYDWSFFEENIMFIVFNSEEKYSEIAESFRVLGRYLGSDFELPQNIGKTLILHYWNGEWISFDSVLEKAYHTINIYQKLKPAE